MRARGRLRLQLKAGLGRGMWGMVLGCLAVACGRADAGEPGKTILGVGSYWRVYEVKSDKVVPRAVLKETDPTAAKPKVFGPDLNTDPPPPEWFTPDFDDRAWFRAPGPFFGGVRGWARRYTDRNTARFCLRGKFTVADPAAVKSLALSLRYRGGVVVYLNGTEVCRQHLPQGTLGPDTPAAVYPLDAYVDAKGNVLPGLYHIGRRIKQGEKDLSARVAGRERSVGPVALPLGRLRKGTNVLAVDVRRSGFRPPALKWSRRNQGVWPHLQLTRLHLAAAGPVVPNTARPAGVQVWNQDVHRIFSIVEYGDPHTVLRPIRLVGARNGIYSAQVVVGSTRAIQGLRAVAAALEREGGGGAVPASSVRVRYVGPSTLGISASHSGLGYPGWTAIPAFAVLSDAPPAKIKPSTLQTNASSRAALGLPSTMKPAAVQPVWITVHVPTDTPAGRYTGALTISAQGIPEVQVPVELEVVDWTLPDPAGFRTFISIYQSPESVAIQYKVRMWSEKHWALLEKSFRLLGYLSNRLVVIPLVNRTEFGNDECMVPWIRKKDGTFAHDFTVHDRYVRLARKHCAIRFMSYQVYRSHGWGPPKPDKPTYVTVVDPAAGKREAMKLPAYGTAESTKLLRPLMAAVRRRFGQGGLAEGATPVLGICHDGGVNRTVAAQFKEVFPEGRWHYGAHGRRNRGYGYAEYLYVPWAIASPRAKRRYGWRPKPGEPVIVMSQRMRLPIQPPVAIRTMAERALLLGDRGAGRMCLDYWPVEGSAKVMIQSLYSRWPKSSAGQRSPQIGYLASPGRDGATSTVKLEMLREGLQEAEGRILIEGALVDKRISGPLAATCRTLLDKRADLCRIAHGNPRPITSTFNAGWQKQAADTYRLAAQVAKTLRAK